MPFSYDKAVAVPIGVDVDYFYYREPKATKNIVGFLGAMSVAHNENAVRHFISEILPIVLQKVPDTVFMVIGGGVSGELRKLESEHVYFTGRVEDVRDYLERCKVFVCPMTFGSGIKTKNLEAMAMGLPIVTTGIGAENINAVNGKDWIVADDNSEFADWVTDLLTDEANRYLIGKNGSDFIKDNFTWNVARKKFEELLIE